MRTMLEGGNKRMNRSIKVIYQRVLGGDKDMNAYLGFLRRVEASGVSFVWETSARRIIDEYRNKGNVLLLDGQKVCR